MDLIKKSKKKIYELEDVPKKWLPVLAKAVKGVKIAEAVVISGVAYQTCAQYLQVLEAKGYLIRTIDRRRTVYKLNAEKVEL